MFQAILLIIGLLALIICIFSNRIGRNGTVALLILFNSSFCIFFIYLFFVVPLTKTISVSFYYNWFSSLPLSANVQYGFYFDFLSFSFICLIMLITTCVIFFSISYMYNDLRLVYFLCFLEFFMFFMLLLVSSNNLIQLFFGWEGVGIMSFLLINFWFFRLDSNKSALKALIFNRVGDVGYLLFIVLVIVSQQSSSFVLLYYNNDIIWYGILFLILAACGKSAQLFLYAWLPDAMEGPTPVSSLLHSATMVTAGVFLLLRMYPLFNLYPTLLYIIIFIGSFTSILTGFFACKKFDIKKIIAYSTCSQLGLMVVAIGFGCVNGSFLHLFVHAFFKCLLFIAAGILIHSLGDEQDIRKLLSSFWTFPLFYLFLLIGSLAIGGFVFMSGYYSKEFILLSSLGENFYILNSFLFIASAITLIYSCRLIFFCFGLNNMANLHFSVYKTNFHIDFFHSLSMIILSFGAIVSGYFFTDSFLNIDFTFTSNQILPTISIDLVFISYGCLLFFFLFYLLVVYWFIQSKTMFFSLLHSRISQLLEYIITLELFFPMLSFISVNLFCLLSYKLIMMCYERFFLDSVFFMIPVKELRDFYQSISLNTYVSIRILLYSISIMFGLLFLFFIYPTFTHFLIISLFVYSETTY